MEEDLVINEGLIFVLPDSDGDIEIEMWTRDDVHTRFIPFKVLKGWINSIDIEENNK